MKKFFQEFRDFILRGNVMSLAVGMIIGAAFQGLINALTEYILSPIIGLFAGANLDSLSVDFLGVTLYYGKFLTAVISFIITAFILFLIVRATNKLFSGKEKEEVITEKQCPYCFTMIDIQATRCPHCTSQLTE